MYQDIGRKYIWFPVLASILTLIMFLQPVESASDKIWQNIQQTKVLRLGIEPIYPPFRFYNSDDYLAGFDIEVAQKTAMYMGLRIEWIPLEKNEFQQALKDGIIDGFVAAIDTKKKENYFVNSMSFLENCGVFIGRKSDESIHGLSDLKGKRIGLFVDKDEEHFIQDIVDEIEVPITSFEMGIALLRENKIDGFFHDKYSTLAYIASQKEKGLKVIELDKERLSHVFVVKKGEEQLLQSLNTALKKIQTNGVYRRIYKKYFGDGI